MRCLSCELLDLAVPVFHDPDAGFSRRLEGLLQKTLSHCGLQQALFLRCSPSPREFQEEIHLRAETAESCPPFPFDALTAADALQRRRHRKRNAALYLPVAAGRNAIGVLVLVAGPERPDIDACLPAFHCLAAYLGQQAATEKISSEAEVIAGLTARLLHGLSRTRSLTELIQTLLPVLLDGSGTAAVMLRPIYGGTLVDRPYYRFSPDFRRFRPKILALEESLAGRVLVKDGHPELFSPPMLKDFVAGCPELGAAVLPLYFQGRPMGFLILFHPDPPKIRLLSWAADTPGRLENLGALIAQGLERVALQDRLEDLIRESNRKLRETHLLSRISRAMHSTLRLNDLMHFILSVATLPQGGGFERAVLFMVNERTGTLQGMLGVTQETAALIFPPGATSGPWDWPDITDAVRLAQHQAPFSRKVVKIRLSLDPRTSAMARSVRQKRIVFVNRREEEPETGRSLAEDLGLAFYACVPLQGQKSVLGVLVVDNPASGEPISANRLEFLEVFASQAGVAMENSILMNRLESAHLELKNTQDRLIQGEKMAVLGEMAASVAHELKNPLVSIGGFAQRLSRRIETDGEEKEYAEIIAREVRRMEEMLGNILSFSKRQVLCFEKCRIERVVGDALALERHALTRAKIHLEVEVDPELPAFQGDEQKLRQVLVNLITNARQAMPQGGKLWLRAVASLLRGKPAILIEVEDTGGGIPPDILENIFTPFFTTKDRGTGLGLSISHRIVEQHLGKIEARNRNKGVVFLIRLPVKHHTGLS